MTWSISIGSVAGTQIKLHLTLVLFLLWIWIAGFLSHGSAAAADDLMFIIGLFACVLAHEFGHILTGRAFGIVTPDVILLPIGGVARMSRMPESPAKELLVAAAGPAVNVMIAIGLVALFGASLAFKEMSTENAVVPLVSRLATANVILAIFNLIPAFPMDGGRILRALLAFRFDGPRATRIAAAVGEGLAILLGFFGLLFNPMLVFISIFVFLAAASEAQLVRLAELGDRISIMSVMMTQFVPIASGTSVAEATEIFLHLGQAELPVVDATGRLLGMLGRRDLALALQRGENVTVVDTLMSRAVSTLGVSEKLSKAIRLIGEEGQRAIGITSEDGRLIGLVTTETLSNLLLFKNDSASSNAEVRGRGPWRPGSGAHKQEGLR